LHQVRAQTQIDLQAQGKNVDFSMSPTTRPLKSGVTLPATCNVGEMFFLSSAAAGANLYGCAAINGWTVESGTGGSSVQNSSQLADLVASHSSSTTLVIGATCSAATPCNVRLGSVTFSFTSSTSATISGGSGTAFIYMDSSGNLTVGHNLTATCNSGCVAVPGITAFPRRTGLGIPPEERIEEHFKAPPTFQPVPGFWEQPPMGTPRLQLIRRWSGYGRPFRPALPARALKAHGRRTLLITTSVWPPIAGSAWR
jgi:hypothetical protein